MVLKRAYDLLQVDLKPYLSESDELKMYLNMAGTEEKLVWDFLNQQSYFFRVLYSIYFLPIAIGIK